MIDMMTGTTVKMALGTGVGCLVVASLGGCSEAGGDAGDDASTSCAGQVLTITPTSVSAGGSVTVRGQYFVNGCADVVEEGSPTATTGPTTDVPLTLASGSGQGQEIARLDATGTLGEIDSSVTIPKGVPTGPATLRLGDAEPVTVSVQP